MARRWTPGTPRRARYAAVPATAFASPATPVPDPRTIATNSIRCTEWGAFMESRRGVAHFKSDPRRRPPGLDVDRAVLCAIRAEAWKQAHDADVPPVFYDLKSRTIPFQAGSRIDAADGTNFIGFGHGSR